MPQQKTLDQARRTPSPVKTQVPLGLATNVALIAEKYDADPNDVVELAVLTLVMGVNEDDPAWTEGVADLKRLKGRGFPTGSVEAGQE